MIYQPTPVNIGVTVQAGTPMTVTEDGTPARRPAPGCYRHG